MQKIWFENKRTSDHDDLFKGVAEPIGPRQGDDPLKDIEQANGIIAGGVFYTPELMDTIPDLKVIARTGIGVDRVNIAAATERGIAVVNTPDAPSVPTAEQTFALLLSVAKQIKPSEAKLRASAGNYHGTHNAVELSGRTLGLAGFGRIARLVAKMAQGFNMKVISFDPFVHSDVAEAAGVSLVGSLEELLENADIVSTHTPLLPETQQMMNVQRFAKMKPGSIFINAGRGGLVDEAALIDALQSGHLYGAGLDVTDPEPAEPSNPLLSMENVVVTPHVASATPEGKTRMFVGAVEQVVQVLKGEKPPHLVNPEVWKR